MSNEDNRRPERQIRDMEGLLKFCLEATRREDAPNNSQFQPMSEERRKWLEEAMNAMTVNPVERMQLCLQMIEEAEVDTETGTEQQVRALTELQDWAEDMDLAKDFIKINGLRVIPKLLTSEVSEIRSRCLELLGNMSQNNPVAQSTLVTLKLLPAMLALLDTDPNPTVRVKALYAISCLVRSNADALQNFVTHDGLSVLVKSLSSSDEKIRVKATFIMSSVCGSNPALKDTLVAKGVIEQLLQILKDEDHNSTHEHIMSALVTIVSNHKGARERCLNSEFDVKTFLCQRIRHLEGKESFQEEKEYAEKLLEILNSNLDESPPQTSSTNLSLMAL